MTASELFDVICGQIEGAQRGVMFGAPCLKTPNGKAAVCLYKDFLVLKPDKKTLDDIMAMDGAGPFDPSGGRPMNGWVQVGLEYEKNWLQWTQKSIDFVGALEAKPKKQKK
jgi:hypothetical protein